MQNMVRAACIAAMIVPIVPLARVSWGSQEPMQHLATTTEDFDKAAKAINAGVSPQDALLEHGTPIRESMAFQVDLWEDLFSSNFDVGTHAYFINELGGTEFYSGSSTVFSGENWLGDRFEITFDIVAPSDFSALTAPEQAALSQAGVQASWGVEGTISTENASRSFGGVIIHGDMDGQLVWQLYPAIDPDGDFMRSTVDGALAAMAAPGSPTVPDSGLTGIDWDCTNDCMLDAQLREGIAKNDLSACLGVAATNLTAALAVCTTASLVAHFFGPLSAVGAGLACVLGALAILAAESTNCHIHYANDLRNSNLMLNHCLQGCGWIIA